jgi:hypothetical protein
LGFVFWLVFKVILEQKLRSWLPCISKFVVICDKELEFAVLSKYLKEFDFLKMNLKNTNFQRRFWCFGTEKWSLEI